jgi:hypothetical protein
MQGREAESMRTKLAVVTLVLLALLVPLVRAQATTESFTIYTDKQTYLVGETVSIYVQANSIDPDQTITVTDVIVYDPNNAIVAEWHGLTIELADTTTSQLVGTLTANAEGTYTVSADAFGCKWLLIALCYFFCWGHHNNVPEVPFGTIVAAAPLLGATGLYLTRKKQRTKK